VHRPLNGSTRAFYIGLPKQVKYVVTIFDEESIPVDGLSVRNLLILGVTKPVPGRLTL
jgi:hypothetical protein